MPTAFYSHPECRLHDMGEGHPECPARLDAIDDHLLAIGLDIALERREAPRAELDALKRAHTANYVESLRDRLEQLAVTGESRAFDPDTRACPSTWYAALRAAGAAVAATDAVIGGEVRNAFCSVRPPGHHATRDQTMGFCFFNNVAVGIRHALDVLGMQRVALVDFDVHHGNGSEDILAGDDRVLMVSTFQARLYPFSGDNPRGANMRNVGLPAYSTGDALRSAVIDHWLPALREFRPQMIFVSAGFDAHRDDDMSHLGWSDADYAWVSERLAEVADEVAEGRIVSTLEGGYDLPALARCVELHLRALLGIG